MGGFIGSEEKRYTVHPEPKKGGSEAGREWQPTQTQCGRKKGESRDRGKVTSLSNENSYKKKSKKKAIADFNIRGQKKKPKKRATNAQ